jgi:hypothetical protein
VKKTRPPRGRKKMSVVARFGPPIQARDACSRLTLGRAAWEREPELEEPVELPALEDEEEAEAEPVPAPADVPLTGAATADVETEGAETEGVLVLTGGVAEGGAGTAGAGSLGTLGSGAGAETGGTVGVGRGGGAGTVVVIGTVGTGTAPNARPPASAPSAIATIPTRRTAAALTSLQPRSG